MVPVMAVTVLEWTLLFTLGTLYLALVVTVGVLTWRKGHYVLFFLGIFIPFLWLVGAILAPGGGLDYGMRGGRR